MHFATKIAPHEDDPQNLMPPGLERSLLDKPSTTGHNSMTSLKKSYLEIALHKEEENLQCAVCQNLSLQNLELERKTTIINSLILIRFEN